MNVSALNANLNFEKEDYKNLSRPKALSRDQEGSC